ncbi:MAG: hypothetical protein IKB34_05440 [Clostridia bacterium]|nr:hypothetical protein [Clostridia bacterium]
MFRFIKENSSTISKLTVYQFALTVFGLLLFTVSKYSQNAAITVGISVFSVLFYLFIIYTNIWEFGARDKIKMDGKRLKPRPMHGLLLGLVSNIPNYLFCIASTVGYVFIDRSIYTAEGNFTSPEWAVNLYAISHTVGSYLNGTYLGITETANIYMYPFTLALITLPAVAACALGYYFGTKEKFPIVAEKRNVDY